MSEIRPRIVECEPVCSEQCYYRNDTTDCDMTAYCEPCIPGLRAQRDKEQQAGFAVSAAFDQFRTDIRVALGEYYVEGVNPCQSIAKLRKRLESDMRVMDQCVNKLDVARKAAESQRDDAVRERDALRAEVERLRGAVEISVVALTSKWPEDFRRVFSDDEILQMIDKHKNRGEFRIEDALRAALSGAEGGVNENE